MGFWSAVTRRKALHDVNREESQLGKVLTVTDLTGLGVGSTLGVGVYVLAGFVSKEVAGPGVVISFFIAAVASVLAGLSFAEFGARVPKAGSAYTYSYVTIGEFVAFLIGWNLIIEYIIGAASVAKGLSVYVDSMMNNTMERYYRSLVTIDNPYLAEYLDFTAFIVSFCVCLALAIGLKESVSLNNLLTAVNITVVLLVVVVGSYFADFSNWQIPASEVPAGAGKGGFLPFGVLGTIKGAATCFFGYVGFDCIAATGEEVKNAQKAIPIAICASLAIVFLSYFGVSAVLTLMWPYYLQNVDSPIPYAFAQIGLENFGWLIAVGSVFGLFASLIGGLYPLPRIIYSMSQDGLLFDFVGKVDSKFKTPFNGAIISGLITGVMAAMLNLKALVDLMSIATLVVYTIVAACVLILRYKEPDTCNLVTHEAVEQTHLLTQSKTVSTNTVIQQIFNLRAVQHPTFLSSAISSVNVYTLCLFCVLLSGFLALWEEDFFRGTFEMQPTIILSFMLLLTLIVFISLSLQPVCDTNLSFKVPFVPLLPVLSIFINTYLMFSLDVNTWIRFGYWIFVGLLIYFGYGVMHSHEGRNRAKRVDYDDLSNQDTI